VDKKYLIQLNEDLIALAIRDEQGVLEACVGTEIDVLENKSWQKIKLEPVGLSGLYLLFLDNVPYELHIEKLASGYEIVFGRETFKVDPITWNGNLTDKPLKEVGTVEPIVRAPMSGIVSEVRVKLGDFVQLGQVLVILESMKMNNEIVAPISGNISDIKVIPDSRVDEGDIIFVISEV